MNQPKTFAELKQFFKKELLQKYEENEIDSFFFLLLEEMCGFSRSNYLLNKDCFLNLDLYTDFIETVNRLKNFEPIQHIIGFTHFYSGRFKTNPDVLIPRQETEELIRLILENNQNNNCPISILDIGTGSGCIAISLAKELRDSVVTAIDVSEKALEVAAFNALLNNVEIDIRQIDVFSDNLMNLPLVFDIIVSNPPYVMEKEKNTILPNVLGFDPHLALFVSDNDPLVFYKRILEFSQKHLKTTGQLYFEINEQLGKEMVLLCTDYSFSNVQLIQDLNKKNRFVSCTKT